MKSIEISDLEFRYDEVTLKIQPGDYVLAQLPLASILEFARRFDNASKEAGDAEAFALKVARLFPTRGSFSTGIQGRN